MTLACVKLKTNKQTSKNIQAAQRPRVLCKLPVVHMVVCLNSYLTRNSRAEAKKVCPKLTQSSCACGNDRQSHTVVKHFPGQPRVTILPNMVGVGVWWQVDGPLSATVQITCFQPVSIRKTLRKQRQDSLQAKKADVLLALFQFPTKDRIGKGILGAELSHRIDILKGTFVPADLEFWRWHREFSVPENIPEQPWTTENHWPVQEEHLPFGPKTLNLETSEGLKDPMLYVFVQRFMKLSKPLYKATLRL